MFGGASSFNQDISDWDTSGVSNMGSMFFDASSFNQDLSAWCVSLITKPPTTFDTGATSWILPRPLWGNCPTAGSQPNFFKAANGITILCPNAEIGEQGDVEGIIYTKRTREQITAANAATTCTSGITNMRDLFFGVGSGFNADISHWDVSSVTDMNRMFTQARSFSQDLSAWDVSSVTDMTNMFSGANLFNSDIGQWDVSNVLSMQGMFFEALSFNQDISGWNTANLQTTRIMFEGAASFNQDISSWDVANVINMEGMFLRAVAFNQPLNSWNTSSVLDMSRMFGGASSFNQPLASWDTSSVLTMFQMFGGASSFNQDISDWDTSGVSNMGSMFFNASSFNQDLSPWCVSLITDPPTTFDTGANSWILPKPQWGGCGNGQFVVQVDQSAGGTVVPNGTIPAFSGERIVVGIVPDNGFTLQSVIGTCSGTLLSPAAEPPNHQIRFFNVDDVMYGFLSNSSANRSLVLAAGFLENVGVDFSAQLSPGINRFDIEVWNGPSVGPFGLVSGDGGWTYGWDFLVDGQVIESDSCGSAGAIGCQSNQIKPGLAHTRTIEFVVPSSNEFLFITDPIVDSCSVEPAFAPSS
jgi:surface protein